MIGEFEASWLLYTFWLVRLCSEVLIRCRFHLFFLPHLMALIRPKEDIRIIRAQALED